MSPVLARRPRPTSDSSMPMRYYIIIKTGWTLSSEAFLGRLRLRWPRVRIEEPSVSWLDTFQDFDFPMERSVLYGSIERSGKALTIDSGALSSSFALSSKAQAAVCKEPGRSRSGFC